MASSERASSRWFLRGVPENGDHVLFGFPYAGVGASSYRDWPALLGEGGFCALQPPGRENRIAEENPPTHADFADQLVEALLPHLDRPYAFLGHCGAFPYMLETVFRLRQLGLPLPVEVFASSWGAPHRGLYGALNFIDLEGTDMVREVGALAERMGRPLPAELAELAAETMLDDLRVQRGYRYDGTPPVPVPVTLVGWTDDDVVPAGGLDEGWSDCAEVSYHLLDGDHGAFLRCPRALRDLITDRMGAALGRHLV